MLKGPAQILSQRIERHLRTFPLSSSKRHCRRTSGSSLPGKHGSGVCLCVQALSKRSRDTLLRELHAMSKEVDNIVLPACVAQQVAPSAACGSLRSLVFENASGVSKITSRLHLAGRVGAMAGAFRLPKGSVSAEVSGGDVSQPNAYTCAKPQKESQHWKFWIWMLAAVALLSLPTTIPSR